MIVFRSAVLVITGPIAVRKHAAALFRREKFILSLQVCLTRRRLVFTFLRGKSLEFASLVTTGKNNGFPVLDILGYLKNTHKNPKFGKVRQVPIGELGWEFPGWDLPHFAIFGIFMGIL